HAFAVGYAFVLQSAFQTRQAKVAPAAFCQGPVEVQFGVGAYVGQILTNNLVLQGYGRGGNNQTFAQGFGDRNGRQQVGQGFACPGAGLDHAGAVGGGTDAV